MDLIYASGEKDEAKLTGKRSFKHQIHNFFNFAVQHRLKQLKA
jgi:hypothetical protein